MVQYIRFPMKASTSHFIFTLFTNVNQNVNIQSACHYKVSTHGNHHVEMWNVSYYRNDQNMLVENNCLNAGIAVSFCEEKYVDDNVPSAMNE